MKHIFALYIVIVSSLTLQGDIIMGVVPQQSPLKLLKVWSPIAKYLSKQSGETITFKTEKSISKFEEVLYSGGYDFAYMNPYHYTVANEKRAYVAKIRASKNIKGILVMKKGSNIDDIKNKSSLFLFPAPNAFAATLLTKYDLINQFKIDLEGLKNSRYVNSHDSVYKALARGIGDIGGGIERTFNNLNDEKTKNSLIIVHTTKEYPSHPFAFKLDMPQELQNKIESALLNIPKELLKPLSMKTLKKVDDKEYDSVREVAKKLLVESER